MAELRALDPNILRTVLWARGGAVERFAGFNAKGKLEALPMGDEERLAACEFILGAEFR